jgi:hypothetical protein
MRNSEDLLEKYLAAYRQILKGISKDTHKQQENL